MKSIQEIKNLIGKRVIVRVDFNLPIKENKILDDFRLQKSLQTIKYLQQKKAITILISHLGDQEKESLKIVFLRLKKHFPKAIFIDSPILSEETSQRIKELEKGDVVLLENLRHNEDEKKNSPSFSRGLSRYGDIYVNEAFSVCHRPHASIIGLPKFLPSYAGFQLLEEIKNLSKIFHPQKPFLFILGGAKFETKTPLIKKFLKLADQVFLAGALANDLLKAKGYEVGLSTTSQNHLPLKIFLKKPNLILPIDLKVIKDSKAHLTLVDGVKKDEVIVDIGPQTVKLIEQEIKKSKVVLFNGPLGKYDSGFAEGTEKVLQIISQNKIYSVIGGGDTVSLISKLKLEKKFNFVSTGGGATLDFLIKETLPGLKYLK